MMNGTFGSDERPGVYMPYLQVAKCVQCPPAWQEDHQPYNTVKTMDCLLRVLEAAVEPVDWMLFRGDGVR